MASILFKECMEALGSNAVIVSDAESDKITEFFEKTVPLCFLSIDWGKIPNKVKVQSPENIIPMLETLLQNTVDKNVYVFWNDASLPTIKTDFISVMNHFDDVICVGFETWFYNPYQGYIIEYRNFHGIHMSLVPSLLP